MEIANKLENVANSLEQRIRPELDVVKDKLSDVNESVVAFVKAHPTQCLIGALALGYLVGRIARAGGGGRHGGA